MSTLNLDPNGYLANVNDWNETVAQELATMENMVLTSAHWPVIEQVREFYLHYAHIPPMRLLIKTLQKKYGAEKFNSIYLHTLFPNSPLRQIARIAGLPKPVQCI